MKQFMKLLRLAKPYKGLFGFSVICMVFYTILNGMSVFSVIPLVDRIISDKAIELPSSMKALGIPFQAEIENFIIFINGCDKTKLLMWIGIFVFVTFLFKGLFLYLLQVSMEIVGQKVARDVRSKLYSKYYALPMTYFAKSRIGELMSRITNDVNLIHEVFSGRYVINIKDSMQIIPFCIGIFIIDWKLSLLCLIILPFLVGPIAMIGRKIRKLFRKTQEKVADISSVINETISGIRIVKIFCMENYEQNRFYKQLDKFRKIRVDVVKKQALYNPLTEVIGGIAVMFVLIVFPRKVMRGEITPGFFVTYLVCLAALIKPIRTMGKLNFSIQSAMSAVDRIFHLLEAEEGVTDNGEAIPFPEIKDKISFSKLSFDYEENEHVLKDIDLEASINKITALVGPSGCGKTTLVNLIPRFFDPQKGQILVDGKDLKMFNLRSLREKIGMVTQETFLFNDTVARNIAYGHEDISMERIEKMAKIAHAAEFIEQLPNAYETVIGEKGARLSGGQKQRIAIARALLKDPPILILDEATSALDTESERIVQDAINTLMKDRTVIVIAHRLTTIMKADMIYMMNEGRIMDSGKHADLLKSCELYKKLYEMQFV